MTETQPPRQRFPTWKQALVIFSAVLVLSVTTCMSVVLLFGEKQLSDTGDLFVLLAVYVSTFAPVVVLVWLVVARVRRGRAERRERKGA